MEGEASNTQAPPVEINAQWIFETYNQQQETNAMILQLLQNQQSQSQQQNQNISSTTPPTEPAPVTTSPTSSSTNRPKHTLSQPEYTHEDPSLYPQFRGLLSQKLRVDALACGDSEYDRVWFGFSCLKGTASSRIFPWIDHAQSVGATFTIPEFFDQLDIAFSDPQKVQKAIAKINLIKQRKRPFREFLHEFEQTLLEAGGWGWDDAVRKGYLKAGINYKLKSLLVSHVEPQGYAEYVNLLRLTSDNLDALEPPRSHPPRSPSPAASASEPMEWQATNAIRGSFVSKEIQDQRRRANQCIKCGGPGHYARNCRNGWILGSRQPAKVSSSVPRQSSNQQPCSEFQEQEKE